MEKFFDMAYVPKDKHVKFEAYKLKEGAAAWCGSTTKHKETPR